MIDKDKITLDWITKVSKESRNADKILVEKVIRALSLLEGLVLQKLSFVFKGGTALMLHLNSSKRLSIDIDIIMPVKPDKLDELLDGVASEQGFLRKELQQRNANSKIDKAHYKFYYTPLHKTSKDEEYVLLDILFEEVQYKNLVELKIQSSFLPEKESPLTVKSACLEDITGDKLTAFAPNTTGIPYFKGKDSMSMEIIKQLYDIGNLFDNVTDIDTIKTTFKKFAETELEYREMNNLSAKDVLEDIYQTSLCIVTRGADGKGDFDQLQQGIQRVSRFIFSESYHIEKAITHASKAAYVATLIKHDCKTIEKYSNPLQMKDWLIAEPMNSNLNRLKKSNPEAFFYWYKIYELEKKVGYMGRSTVHYADNKTNNALKSLHNKLRPAGTPVQRVEYIIELLLLRIFETKIKQDDEFKPLRELFSTDYKWLNPKTGKEESNENRLFSYLPTVSNDQILSELNDNFFPFYSTILHSARKVFKGNLPQKVQDQLVLIEEVFSNSNFTNNVNSGNLGEVINIVSNDIEETRLLKTDLLGDAIESALSETGGTKDVGLFRTPDHVRQFMTALIEPTFDDVIFDPACGTGGFLFDAFEFVMRRVDPTREWPGEKAHSELTDWFDNYFEKNQIEFPSIEQTTQFYRSGVTGVEYLGMIRKMAAINFYIRGLNPANIEQGDSLAKYRPVTDHETKSVILANPPFGAQRDQEAYPDVWGEYSKESETTILFVKLMFEHLKQGGQCAVVVSEGFHTWDQFSAKALRKMLLEEAQLKAVISLPQGLFVSKNGQGPKTSILVFEKGGKTDWTWFYKVTNDGYTMGTNRKEQKGNQLVECLSLYHEFVKHGKKPKETKNQFCIPSEWVKTLDPRIKEKIRTETRDDMEAKGKIEKAKKAEELDKKIKAKKITEADKQMELKVFDQMLENRIQNEIAKRIDKAHNYSFNFANYKSTISDSQIAEWTEALKHIQPNGATTLDEVYKKLSNSKPENILPYLLKLNPANALEADIAREYVSNLDNDLILKHKELNVIKEILKSGAKYPMVKLKDYLILNENKIKPNKAPDVNYKVLGVSNEIGIFLNEKLQAEETNQSYYVVAKNEFCYNPYRINVGSIALNTNDYDNQIISGAYIVFACKEDELNPKYLDALFKSKVFLDYVNEKANGGVRMNFKFEDMEAWEIPLPSIDEQAAIVDQIEKQKAIIEGAEKIDKNFEFEIPISQDKRTLNAFIKDSLYGLSVKLKSEGKYPVLRMNNLDTLGRWHLDNLKYTDDNLSKERLLEFGDYIFNRTNSVDLVGKSSVVDFEMLGSWAGYLIRLKLKDGLNPFYLKYLFTTKRYREYFKKTCKPAGGQANINADELGAVSIDYFEPEIQNQIVAELDSKMQILEGLRKMKTEAQKKINQILADVWGIEYVEPIKVEVEDEQEN